MRKRYGYQNGEILDQCPKISHDYTRVGKIYEAGLILTGPEVRAIRAKGISVRGARVWLEDNAAWLNLDSKISSADPRDRIKLLLNKSELLDLMKAHLSGLALLVPAAYFTKDGKIKILVIAGKLNRELDKREIIKKKDLRRERAQGD